MKQFKLMTSLYGHTGDVKSLCPTRESGGFVSVSRDLTAKLWHSQNAEYVNYSVIFLYIHIVKVCVTIFSDKVLILKTSQRLDIESFKYLLTGFKINFFLICFQKIFVFYLLINA